MNCPQCAAEMTLNGFNHSGSIRYKCPNCGKTASEGGKAIGRPKQYESNAERLKAWRKKKKNNPT